MKRVYLNWTIVLLASILGLALVARAYGANFPRYHWDEGITVTNVLYVSYANLKPPSYINGNVLEYLVLIIWYAYLVLAGQTPNSANLITAFYRDTPTFMLLARAVPILTGTVTVAVVYLLGRKLYGVRVGLLAALFMALTFLNVSEAHYARSHVLGTLFVTLAVYFSARILERPTARDYGLAGICIGLATAAKYSGIEAIVALIAAHFCRAWTMRAEKGWLAFLPDRNLLIGLDAAGLAFFITTPYALLDFTFYMGEIKSYLFNVVARTWINPEGQPVFLFYLTEHLRGGMGLGLELAALTGVAYAVYRRKAQDIVLAIFSLVLYVALDKGPNFARYALPLLPLLLIAAARLLDDATRALGTRLPGRWVSLILVVVAVALVTPSVLNIVRYDYWITQPDTRQTAAEWFMANVPEGATVAVEGAGVLGPPLPENQAILASYMAAQSSDSFAYLELAAIRKSPLPGPGYAVDTVFRLDQRHVGGVMIETIPTVQYYAQRGFEYLVTVDWMQRDDSDHYSPKFQESLDTLYEQVADFQPTIAFRFDPYSWRMDYEALARVNPGQSGTGGPHLRVYRWRSHGISGQ